MFGAGYQSVVAFLSEVETPEGRLVNRFGGRFGGASANSPLLVTIDFGFVRRIPGRQRRGDTARRTNPGNRAHAFRITVVDKQTPSNKSIHIGGRRITTPLRMDTDGYG